MKWLSLPLLAALLILPGKESPAQDQPKPEAAADPLPERAIRRLGTAKLRHGSRILTLAYSPSGRLLAAGGGDDPVRLWDADTGKELRQLKDSWVHAMAFTPRGGELVTAGAFKTLRRWEVATGKENTSNKFEGHTTAVKALAISPSHLGDLMASGGQDGLILLWEYSTAKAVAQFKAHSDEITSLAFYQNHDAEITLLISGSSDRTAKLWDCETNKFLRSVDAGCAVSAVALGPDGKTFFTGGDDNLVRVWDVATGKLLQTLKGHQGTVTGLQVHRKENVLVSNAQDGSVRVWDLADYKEVRALRTDRGDGDALALTRDGKFAACAGTNNAIRIFEVASGKEAFPAPGHLASLTGLALSPDGKLLVSASATGKVVAWNAADGKELRSWTSPYSGELTLAFSPDGKTVATGGGTGAVHFWDPATGQQTGQLPGNPADPLLSLAYSPRGAFLAVGRRQQGVEVWAVKEKKVVRQLKYDGPAYALAFAQDDSTLAVSGGSKIAVHDLKAGKEINVFVSKEGPPATLPAIASLAFAPDGKTLAAGCYDGIIRLMDVASGKEIRGLEGHGHVAYALAFSADGRVLASGSFDKTVRLWEAFSGSTIAELKGHQGPVAALAFLKDDRGLFSASADTSILHWDATGISPGAALPALAPNPAELQTYWQDLAAENASRGQGVMWRLVAGGKASVSFLEKQIYLVDPKKVDQLFADLNSDEYKVRLKADIELEKYGRWMEGRLKVMHKNPPTLEVQRRIERLLAKLAVPGSLSLNQERLRVRRVLQALEQLGDPEAVAVLQKLATGAPEPDLQVEASQSLQRLKGRAKS